MPLRVICDVDQQSSHSRRQPLFSYGSRVFQIRSGQRPNASSGIRQRRTEFRKKLVVRCARIKFRPQTIHLLFIQILAFSIGQQTVEAARQVPYMKCD